MLTKWGSVVKLSSVNQQSENILIKRLANRAELNGIAYISCVVEKE